jgi:hypothetical protein
MRAPGVIGEATICDAPTQTNAIAATMPVAQ